MSVNKFLFLLALLIFTACKDKQAGDRVVVNPEPIKTKVEQSSTEATKTILCFGNSLTAGYGLDEHEAWPSLLQEQLDSMDISYKVVNAGLSGETTSGGLNRLDWVTKQKVDIFILELGANDMLRGLAVENTKVNLSEILTRVRKKYPQAKLVLAGMLAPANMGKEYAAAFNKIYYDLAMQHKAALIPFFLDEVAGQAELNLPDGKHPNAEGQKVVLRNVWHVLQPLL